jgi:predicted transcriptional regulator of viral defense system
MGEKSASPDATVARIAELQHGVVSIRQLQAAGLGRNAVSLRVHRGRLHRLHQGVYAVGHRAISHEGRWMAAILASGRPTELRADSRSGMVGDRVEARMDTSPGRSVLALWGAALSHRSAAGLWGLLSSTERAVDVSVPGDGGRAGRRGIRMHRSQTLLPAVVTLHRGIPVTTPARTIADLRRIVAVKDPQGVFSAKALRRAIRQADVLGLPIGPEPGLDRTRSELERDFLRLCRRSDLPAPVA